MRIRASLLQQTAGPRGPRGQQQGRQLKIKASVKPDHAPQPQHHETPSRGVEEASHRVTVRPKGGVGIGRRQLAAQCAASALALSQMDIASAVELTATELAEVRGSPVRDFVIRRSAS